MMLAALLPTITLAIVLPVPLMADVPVSVRFSVFEPRVQSSDETTISMPAPVPSMTVSPAPTWYVSLPAPPLKVLAAPLPVRTLSRSLPVALIAVVPVRLRFSVLMPSVNVTDDCTVSVPSFAASLTMSEPLSTT